MTTDDKKSSFLDRLSGKVQEGFKTNPGDVIHEGISDDELDKLLSGYIKSSSQPPQNPADAQEVDATLLMDALQEDAEVSHDTTVDTSTSNSTEQDMAAKESSGNEFNVLLDPFVEREPLPVSLDADEEPAVDLVIDAPANEAHKLHESGDTQVVEADTENLNPTTTIEIVDGHFESSNAIQISGNEETNSVEIDEIDIPVESDVADNATSYIASEALPNIGKDVTSIDENVKLAELDVIDIPTETDLAENENNASDNTSVEVLTEASTDIADNTAKIDTEADESNAATTTVITPLGAVLKQEKESTDAEQSVKPTETQTKPTISGKRTMSDQNQLDKIQSDIDDLKRKIHAMSSEYFTAATDSSTLIGEIREFDANTEDDFTGTYNQVRELRKILIDARKLFTQLPVTLDELEEALENDLYMAKK